MSKFIMAALLFAVLIGWHYGDRQIAVTKAIHTTETRLTKEYTERYNKQVLNASLTTAKLHVDAREQGMVKDEAIRVLNATLDNAIVRLQDRPTRASGGNAPGNPSNRKACTGRELYREDGTFLAREAARAEKVRIERDYYYERYRSVKQEVDALKSRANGLNGSSSNSEPLP